MPGRYFEGPSQKYSEKDLLGRAPVELSLIVKYYHLINIGKPFFKRAKKWKRLLLNKGCHPERQPKGLPEAGNVLAMDSLSWSQCDSGRSFGSIRPLADSAQDDSFGFVLVLKTGYGIPTAGINTPGGFSNGGCLWHWFVPKAVGINNTMLGDSNIPGQCFLVK